jgi:uncharacterized protein (DUF302 family)
MNQDTEVEIFPVEHVRIRTEKPFAEVVRLLETVTGVFDPARMKGADADAVNAMAGSSGFMRFASWDHGAALRTTGGAAGEAVRFVIGNPAIAVKMTSRRISSALYAPLSLLIAGDGHAGTLIEYDQPSSLFAQFEDAEIDGVARELDRKIEALIQSIGGFTDRA